MEGNLKKDSQLKDRQLNIAMVAACPFPYPRGTPIRILRLAEALSRRGHQVHIITYHHGKGEIDPDIILHRIPSVSTYQRFEPGPTYQKLLLLDPLLAINLFQVLREYDIDVIHAHHYEGLLVSVPMRKWAKVPLVYDAHTLCESELPFYKLGLSVKTKKFIGRHIDRWLPRWSDHVISVTRHIRTKLIQDACLAPDKITVIPNGVESEMFEVKREDLMKIGKGSKTLIFTGNLSPYQGIDLLLKAFKEVIAQKPDVCLLIVTSSSFEMYEGLSRELGIRKSINIFPSQTDGLPKLLAGADIALNPRTECDGIPQKLLNYMAASKAIVSFEGAAPILEHGKTGWVVENRNIHAFAASVIHLLEDTELTRELGENARTYIKSNFNWDVTAEKTEEVYQGLPRQGVSA